MKILHNVLGTNYTVETGDRKTLDMCEEHSGECKVYTKEILVCTEKEDCTKEELNLVVSEIVAHEIFHAYVNEAGIDIDERTEEAMASFFMKNWRKMNNSILEVLDVTGFLDK